MLVDEEPKHKHGEGLGNRQHDHGEARAGAIHFGFLGTLFESFVFVYVLVL